MRRDSVAFLVIQGHDLWLVQGDFGHRSTLLSHDIVLSKYI